MTHLGFVAASYGLGVLVPAGFALAAFLRMRAAGRRLAAIDPRTKGSGMDRNVGAAGDTP